MRISESKSGFYTRTSSPRFANEEGFVDPEVENIDEEALAELDIEDESYRGDYCEDTAHAYGWGE